MSLIGVDYSTKLQVYYLDNNSMEGITYIHRFTTHTRIIINKHSSCIACIAIYTVVLLDIIFNNASKFMLHTFTEYQYEHVD